MADDETLRKLTAQLDAERGLDAIRARLAATQQVLADRERELRDLKGPCSNPACALHQAHSGPCPLRKAADRLPTTSATDPTDYEVWRDALTLAVIERSHIDGNGIIDSTGLLARAKWLWNELNLGPVSDNHGPAAP